MIFGFTFLNIQCGKKQGENDLPNPVACLADSLPGQQRTIFVLDKLPNATEEVPVAIFKFMQEVKTYKQTACKNKPNECAIKLYVQNVSGYPLRISYSLNFQNGPHSWSNDGFAILPEDSQVYCGVVANHCSWISDGTLEVLKRAISYEE